MQGISSKTNGARKVFEYATTDMALMKSRCRTELLMFIFCMRSFMEVSAGVMRSLGASNADFQKGNSSGSSTDIQIPP